MTMDHSFVANENTLKAVEMVKLEPAQYLASHETCLDVFN